MCKENADFFFCVEQILAPFLSLLLFSSIFSTIARSNNHMRKDSKRDISQLLSEWPFQAGTINARIISGADGLPHVQVRLDLGILQMHADGRPDGLRPQGAPSWLEWHEHKIEQSEFEEAAEKSGEPVREQRKSDVQLSPEECRMLRDEAAQYYQRYVACLALEDFDRVVRDTTRNLRVLNLCAKYAQQESDKAVLEQFRAYITMIRARALASQMIKDNELKAAVLILDDAIEAIRKMGGDASRAEIDASNEVQMLQNMRDALVPRLPVSLKAELKARLQRALETENYELAAILRDELKQLPEERG
jgi:hypothetical protein